MFGTIRQNYIVKDRVEAGSRLAERLLRFKRVPNQAPDTLILALPRGGVPVAFEIARKLDQPLDLMVVRKLGLPFHKEVAMGALYVNFIYLILSDTSGLSNANIGAQIGPREM